MAEIQLQFDLPYPLHVEGTYPARAAGETFAVVLQTHHQERPRFPGAESVENISLVHEDTNILAHTSVVATFSPTRADFLDDERRFFADLGALAIALANVLITGVRVGYGEDVLEYIHQPERLGPIQFAVSGAEKGKPTGGVIDPLMGGITFRKPSRSGPDATRFAQIVSAGDMPSVGEELHLDAQRYRIRGNRRMALANLAISFEVRLSDALGSIAAAAGDANLERQIAEATLGDLGQGLAKQTLGYSLDNTKLAGARARSAYVWLRTARNKILHKAQTAFEVDAVRKDFADETELAWLFGEYDFLLAQVEADAAKARARPGPP